VAAESRATRPFDRAAVRSLARKAGAPVARGDGASARASTPTVAAREAAAGMVLRPHRGWSTRSSAVHEMLDSLQVDHQFGRAIALAWYRSPRATTDIDLNITVDPDQADPVLGALQVLRVRVREADRRTIRRDGQARLVQLLPAPARRTRPKKAVR
jgi:hypothetical protein